jgi:hypothetical protein
MAVFCAQNMVSSLMSYVDALRKNRNRQITKLKTYTIQKGGIRSEGEHLEVQHSYKDI